MEKHTHQNPVLKCLKVPKGHTTWIKGKTHTPESRAKMSESKKGHILGIKARKLAAHIG